MKRNLGQKILLGTFFTSVFMYTSIEVHASIFNKFNKFIQRFNFMKKNNIDNKKIKTSISSLKTINEIDRLSINSEDSFHSCMSTPTLKRDSSLESTTSIFSDNSSVSLSDFGLNEQILNEVDNMNIQERNKLYNRRSKLLFKTNSIVGSDVYDFNFDDVEEIKKEYWYHQYRLENGETITVISNKEPKLTYKVGSFVLESPKSGKSKFKYIQWISGKELIEQKKLLEQEKEQE